MWSRKIRFTKVQVRLLIIYDSLPIYLGHQNKGRQNICLCLIRRDFLIQKVQNISTREFDQKIQDTLIPVPNPSIVIIIILYLYIILQ